MEIWDILDANGNHTGRNIERGKPLTAGEYHLLVHILIQDEQGRFLIRKRTDHLPLLPGVWALTGGFAIKG